jgi:hypothetical protein
VPRPTLAAAVARFPLLGRPRPACPALPLRIQEVADAVTAAEEKAEHAASDAAHALNKAALIASDCGLPDLAQRLCWQHIDTYRRLTRPLTIREARYLLEPVLNLARLHIRAEQGTTALQLLDTMYQAVTRRCDLTLDGHRLPTAHLAGDKAERRELREWVWLQLIGEGVRALALANRWTDAAEHARRHNGIGVHLMEGRQAAIIAHCTQDDLACARELLAQSTPAQPWEQDIATCLHLMCTAPTDPTATTHLTTAVDRYRGRTPITGYASYRARLGLTIATLATDIRPDLAAELVRQIADEAITSADGYTARDVLGFRQPNAAITQHQKTTLTHLTTDAGLGTRSLPDTTLDQLTTAADAATHILNSVLHTSV